MGMEKYGREDEWEKRKRRTVEGFEGNHSLCSLLSELNSPPTEERRKRNGNGTKMHGLD